MTTITTGDPTLDSLIAWGTGGGKLQSAGAILAIGSIIKLVVIPILNRIFAKYNVNFTGPNKMHVVIGCGFAIVMIVNLATRQGLTLGDSLLVGIQAGIAAIGIHEAGSTLKDASKAQAAIAPATDTAKGAAA